MRTTHGEQSLLAVEHGHLQMAAPQPVDLFLGQAEVHHASAADKRPAPVAISLGVVDFGIRHPDHLDSFRQYCWLNVGSYRAIMIMDHSSVQNSTDVFTAISTVPIHITAEVRHCASLRRTRLAPHVRRLADVHLQLLRSGTCNQGRACLAGLSAPFQACLTSIAYIYVKVSTSTCKVTLGSSIPKVGPAS